MASHERTGRHAARRTPPHNLPAHLTSFIGRGRDKAEIRDLIRAARLITLTGSGGSGKTRLALETARELLYQFPDGVWLAELAPLTDPRSIPRAVALAVGLRDESERPLLDMLIAHLREKRVLIILDNCEHVIDGRAALSDRRRRARRANRVKVVAVAVALL